MLLQSALRRRLLSGQSKRLTFGERFRFGSAFMFHAFQVANGMVSNWAGPPAMLMIFRKLFGSFSCQQIVRQNNFANFQHYYLQKVSPIGESCRMDFQPAVTLCFSLSLSLSLSISLSPPLFQTIPVAMALLRNSLGVCPPDVLRFLLDLFKYNDNTKNRLSDCWYRAALIEALGNTASPFVTVVAQPA